MNKTKKDDQTKFNETLRRMLKKPPEPHKTKREKEREEQEKEKPAK